MRVLPRAVRLEDAVKRMKEVAGKDHRYSRDLELGAHGGTVAGCIGDKEGMKDTAKEESLGQ